MDDLHRQLNYRIRALQFLQQNRHPNSHDVAESYLKWVRRYLHPHMDISWPTRARTWDRLINSQLLYQLSYRPLVKDD